jgi:hypothetical protein
LKLSADSQRFRPNGFLPVDMKTSKLSSFGQAWMNQLCEFVYALKYYESYDKFHESGDFSDFENPLFSSEQKFRQMFAKTQKWDVRNDMKLASFVQERTKKIINKDTKDPENPLTMNDAKLEFNPDDKYMFPELTSFDIEFVRLRYSKLKKLNVMFSSSLNWFDMKSLERELSEPEDTTPNLLLNSGRTALLCKFKPLFFVSSKRSVLSTMMEKTNKQGYQPEITLDRMQQVYSKANAEDGSEAEKNTLFYQAFKQLNKMDAAVFRCKEQAFKVRFSNEEGIDMGGPYREAITAMTKELFSDKLSLFILCPNAKQNFGKNRDKWILNPGAKSPVHLSMFTFLGKLIGLILRSNMTLDMNLAPIVWKLITGEKVDSMSEVESIDEYQVQFLKDLLNLETQGVNAENFQEAFQYALTATLSDTTQIELVPNGKDVLLQFDERKKYVDDVLELRVNESKPQIEALMKGLGQVIPLGIYYIFIHVYLFRCSQVLFLGRIRNFNCGNF